MSGSMQSSGVGGKDEVGASRAAPVQRKRVPLKVDQIRRLTKLVNEMREQLGDERALKDENFRTLLRLLQAHLYPLPGGSFTFSQRFALKLQVLIFQCLQTKKPLPKKLVDAMESGLTVAKYRPQAPGEKLGPKNVSGDQPESKYLMPPDARLVLRKPDVTVTKPAPINPALLLEERERLVLSYAEEYEGADPKIKKYNISVELLKRQTELRAEIVAEHALAEEDGRLGSRTRGRVLRGLQREYERADRTRTKIREQEEAERRQIKTRWMNALHQHIAAFRNSREAVRRAVRSVNRGVLKHHEDVHRIADRAEREAEKKRIQKLKENDEEGYLELVRETKNQRLMEVLKQTDTYLETLSATLKQERIESGENLEEDEVEDDQRKYLDVAHARSEIITEQPLLLEFGQLKEYQREGLQWMVSLYNNRLNGILADEMGLGKTVQTIALLCHLVEKKANPGPYLIIVPLATMHNWRAEFERWAPKLQVVIFQGDKKRRKQLFERHLRNGSMNVVLATFEYVILGKGALSQLNWQYIIIDEGHRIKNHESKLSVILAQKYTSRNRLLLTGTPLQNSLGELWALLNFLLPKVFNSCDTFETWFSAPFENLPEGEEAPKVLSEEEELLIIRRLHRVLQPFLLRRLKSDVLKMGEQLPSKQEDVVVCDMSAWQQHTYDRIVQNEPMVYTNSHGRTCYDRPANPKMQLRKIANHPYLFHEEYSSNVDDGPELWRASGKFDMLDACLQKLLRSGHRVLVFNQMTKIVDLQERLLRYRNIPFLRLDGATKPEDRSSSVKEFNDPATIYNVFLLTTRAGGLGINLQTADTVIIFDSDWNPQADLQAADRAHRIGQQREVRILRFVTAKSVEEDVLERATFKRGLEEKIIQAGMFDDKAKDSERQARLRDLLKDKEEEVRNEKEDLPTPDEINQMLARGDHEIEIFQKVDDERKLEIDNAPALMEENELPDWLTDPDPELLPAAARQDFFNQNGDMELPTQRRAAAKKQVYNIDRLTDEQYLRALEGEPIPESSPMPVPKTATKKRRNEAGPESSDKKESGRKRRRIAADDDESAASDSGQSSRGAVETAGAASTKPAPQLTSPAAKRLHRKASSASSGELSENEMEDIVMEGSVAAGGAALMPVRTGGPQTSDEDAEDGEVEDGEIEEDDGDRDADGEGDVSDDADAGADLDADADVDVNAVIGDGTVAPPEPDEGDDADGDDGDEDEEIEIDEVDVAEDGEDAEVADVGAAGGERTAVTDDEEPPNGRASAKDDTSANESDRRDGPTGGVDRGSEDDDSESGDDQSYSSEDDRDSN